jgi:hypothetical protein
MFAHTRSTARSMHRSAVLSALLLATLASLTPRQSQACASCGCTLSADAATGYSTQAGWRMSLEYDYIDQDELRSGTRSVSQVPNGNELEHETLNQYITAGLSYSPTPDWNVSLFLPYVHRTHSTYGEFDSSQPLPDLSTSSSSSLGDARVVGSYQGLLATKNLGIQLGLKLPTGDYGTDVKFNGGPLEGQPLDASLQPGTGSTDVIVGAYYFQAISQDFDFFINGQYQAAVKHRQDEPGNDFRPGNATSVSLGLRYESNPKWVPQLQLNLLHKSPDQGALADVQSTAGNVVYLSPGLTAQVVPQVYLYAFAQLPVYSNLFGYQLLPRWTASMGLSHAF